MSADGLFVIGATHHRVPLAVREKLSLGPEAAAALQAEFAGTEVELRVRLEPLMLEEITRVWEALDGSYQLSVSYEVSVVNIMPELEPEQVSPVTISMPEHGLIVSS